ncbi:SRPBCC family protein [Amycolatopsis orientalis]|uniref:SRPBCC family protein n=1 Tax=Amycolatopsis orientalis TaxID=31958 RepID=UPI0003A92FD2|nr:SRPBCC family protein [Amycolatopsis orientalis]
MAEFECERRIAADAGTVFRTAADRSTLDRWLPGTVSVHPAEPPGVDVDVAGATGEPGLLRERRDQFRLEWGRRGSPDYSGWLQVASAEGGTSYATLHLSFLGDDPRNHGGEPAEHVDRQLRESLDRLAALVEG